MTGASSGSQDHDFASVLARHGELTVALEDERDPEQCRELRQRLAELDATIDAVLQRSVSRHLG